MTTLLARYNKAQNITKKISDNFCIYNSNDFLNIPKKIAVPNKSGYAIVKVIGTSLPRLADWTIEFSGNWKQNAKYGYTFFADSYHLISPSTERGIERFLCSKSFPKIGETTAKNIVKEFGLSTLEVIEKTPNYLLRVEGITLEKLKIITECYQKDVSHSKLSAYLATYGISQNMAQKVYAKYGDNSLNIIKENPYMIQDIKGIGFLTCEKIARVEQVALDSYIRIQGAIIETIKSYCESTGNMFMLLDDFKNKTLFMLNSEFEKTVVDEDVFKKAVIEANNREIIKFSCQKFVYLKQFYEAEDNVARKISAILSENKTIFSDKINLILDNYCQNEGKILSNKQKIAVKTSLEAPISIITGGPGTGKTTILKAIIDVYHSLYPDNEITLLAPTGKAAARMSETTGYIAKTIHSKLNIFDDFISSKVKIPTGLIAIDETSMVDNLLLEQLLEAIDTKSQVIFIGDINQLPSVGVGAVLQEMITSSVIPTSKLTEVFRQKDNNSIIENAIKVNEGNSNLVYDDSFEIIKVNDEKEAIEVIKERYIAECKKYKVDNVALLSPLRHSQNGRFVCVSDNLNTEIQNTINPSHGFSIVCNGIEYRENDRVLKWKNTKDISNGDVGVIKEIGQDSAGIYAKIDWDNGKSTIENREGFDDITLAYAMSVHKSQGSEYDSVIIPMLANQKCRIFKRNLLYTAITRSKKHVILICDKELDALNHCIETSDTNKRNTLLSKRIVNYSSLSN